MNWVRQPRQIALAVLPTLATLVLVEVALRAFPGLLPIDVGTAIYSVYGTKPGDIYFFDRPTRSNFMWPDFRTRAYWNGYVWEHRTDALGFRNPADLRERSIVWLGDSMIYGHGVEESETAVARLRDEYGLAAYNAARQGDCLYQEYLVARRLLPALAPRTLVLTVFLNDLEDLEFYRSAEEIAAPPELTLDVSALEERLAHPDTRTYLKPRRQLHRLKLWRLYRMARHRWKERQRPPPADGAPPGFLRPYVEQARWDPIARYYTRVIGDLVERARNGGAELVLLQLDIGDSVPGAIAPQDRMRDLLESIARERSVRLLATRSLFEGCEGCFLPHDGHLSAEGHQRLADFVASSLRTPHSG